MLARIKLNSIEKNIWSINKQWNSSWRLYDNYYREYRELKESMSMVNSQRSDTEKINLIEEGKKNCH